MQRKMTHLYSALASFTAWLLVAYLLYRELQALHGLQGVLDNMLRGEYEAALLLGVSILLLALSIRSFFLYVTSSNEDIDK